MATERVMVVFPLFDSVDGGEQNGMIVQFTGSGFWHLIASVGVWFRDHMIPAPPAHARGVWVWEGEIEDSGDDEDIAPIFEGGWREAGSAEVLEFASGRLWG